MRKTIWRSRKHQEPLPLEIFWTLWRWECSANLANTNTPVTRSRFSSPATRTCLARTRQLGSSLRRIRQRHSDRTCAGNDHIIVDGPRYGRPLRCWEVAEGKAAVVQRSSVRQASHPGCIWSACPQKE